jgi:hypothetical protein
MLAAEDYSGLHFSRQPRNDDTLNSSKLPSGKGLRRNSLEDGTESAAAASLATRAGFDRSCGLGSLGVKKVSGTFFVPRHGNGRL